MSKHVKFQLPIIPVELHLVSLSDPSKFLKKTHVDTPDFIGDSSTGGAYATYRFHDGSLLHAVFLPDEWDLKIVYHEALHTAFGVLADVGADTQDEEQLAYWQQYVVEQIAMRFYGLRI